MVTDMSTLYIVATPIGNLEDITLRAIRLLNEVDLILCEDTRVTKKLLDHYSIATPTHSYNAHATDAKHEKIQSLLSEGKDVALVSDAGTPTISDPGVKLIEQLLGASQNVGDRFSDIEIKVVPIPGASALTTALCAAGLPVSEFTFLGFLPHKKGRQTLFAEIAESKRTVVFYESVHRILKTLQSLEDVLDGSREVVVARELTKMHEQIIRGSAPEIRSYFEAHLDHVKGEFVVVVAGAR